MATQQQNSDRLEQEWPAHITAGWTTIRNELRRPLTTTKDKDRWQSYFGTRLYHIYSSIMYKMNPWLVKRTVLGKFINLSHVVKEVSGAEHKEPNRE